MNNPTEQHHNLPNIQNTQKQIKKVVDSPDFIQTTFTRWMYLWVYRTVNDVTLDITYNDLNVYITISSDKYPTVYHTVKHSVAYCKYMYSSDNRLFIDNIIASYNSVLLFHLNNDLQNMKFPPTEKGRRLIELLERFEQLFNELKDEVNK